MDQVADGSHFWGMIEPVGLCAYAVRVRHGPLSEAKTETYSAETKDEIKDGARA